MIVVIGSPQGRRSAGRIVADGFASLVAVAVADLGTSVQVVGRIGDDPAADAVLGDLAQRGVGHVAILRDPAHPTPVVDEGALTANALPTDGADVELALRYLTDFSVLVLADADDASVARVAIDAAAWGEADLIVIRPLGREGPTTDPTDPTDRSLVLGPDDDEPLGTFAARIGRVAALLDAGEAREAALEVTRFRSAR